MANGSAGLGRKYQRAGGPLYGVVGISTPALLGLGNWGVFEDGAEGLSPVDMRSKDKAFIAFIVRAAEFQ